ncbi:MAG: CpsB/CapC family capsule biosynthesis tyrosine phosphatase [Oscillospiraceae bacterium]
MTDLHTHILPCIDDGSIGPSTSGLMLASLAEQGVDTVALTPHFYPDRMSIEAFLRRRERAFASIQGRIPSGLAVCCGAEVAISRSLPGSALLAQLCIGKSGLLLLELPENGPFAGWMLETAAALRDRQGVTPVLAHPERCAFLRRRFTLVGAFAEAGCLFQINAASLFNRRRRFVHKLIKAGYVQFWAPTATI